MKVLFLSIKLRDQLGNPIKQSLIGHARLYQAVMRNLRFNLNALLTHCLPPLCQAEATAAAYGGNQTQSYFVPHLGKSPIQDRATIRSVPGTEDCDFWLNGRQPDAACYAQATECGFQITAAMISKAAPVDANVQIAHQRSTSKVS